VSRSVRFEPEALAEVSHAVNWYEDRRSGLGADFLRALDGTVNRITDQRILGLRLPGLDSSSTVRRVAVPRFPYHVVFQVVDEVVRVLAVPHNRRRPGYWADRITD
jgi:toxin ParE1/3/4